MTEYLAIIFVGAGSSYSRGTDLEQVIKDVSKITVQDWSSLYDLDAKEAKVNVFDVTGNNKISWDYSNVKGDNPEQPPKFLEVRNVVLPKKRKRK